MRAALQPGNLLKQAVLLLASVLALVPTLYMVVTALKSDEEYAIDKLGFPKAPVLENFRSVLVDSPFLHWMLNSAVLVAGSVILSTAISVLGAYLAWSLICAEVMFAAAKSKDMPKIFGNQNANRVPANALWLTNAVVSLFVISTYWSQDAFNFMLDMASVTSLLPYLLVAGYGVLLARSGEGYKGVENQRGRDQIFSWIAVVYVLFMFVAAGLKYVLLVAVLYLGGWGFPLPVEWIVNLTGQPIDAPLVQVITATTGIVMTVLKAYLLVFFAILLRWTVPRVRIDQLLDLGWKFL